jgi:hypothetical protein
VTQFAIHSDGTPRSHYLIHDEPTYCEAGAGADRALPAGASRLGSEVAAARDRAAQRAAAAYQLPDGAAPQLRGFLDASLPLGSIKERSDVRWCLPRDASLGDSSGGPGAAAGVEAGAVFPAAVPNDRVGGALLTTVGLRFLNVGVSELAACLLYGVDSGAPQEWLYVGLEGDAFGQEVGSAKE